MDTKDMIRRLRTEKGLSQDELAEKLFVSYRGLTGNIRKAGWQGSAQESGGGGSTNRTDVAF